MEFEMNAEMLWESFDSLTQQSASVCTSVPRTPEFSAKDYPSDLAELFNDTKSDGLMSPHKELGFDFAAVKMNDNIAIAGEDLNFGDVDWLDQKIDLELFDQALQGEIMDDLVLPPNTNNLQQYSTIKTSDLGSPCPTIDSDIGSAGPSSPEQFVPSNSQPMSPVNTYSAQEIFMSLMEPSSSSDEVSPAPSMETVTIILEPVMTYGKTNGKKSAKIKADNPLAPKKRKHRQVKFLDASEKRLRKKGQNKTAATRYRQKKRVELDSLTNEKMDLEVVNTELHSKVDKISTEIQYLKRLLREAFIAKGLIKKQDVAPHDH